MIETSPTLDKIAGIRHGFTTREGGVSGGHFASLNVCLGVDDDPEAVHENRRRMLSAMGLAAQTPLVTLHQIHGAKVLDVATHIAGQKADGLKTTTHDLALGVRTADCAPVLLVRAPDKRAEAVAAVHAGWRGATSRIVHEAFGMLTASHGAEINNDIYAAIGACIGYERFQVGPEVIEAAKSSVDDSAVPHHQADDGSWYLDLMSLIRLQLLELGVPAENIDLVGGCTHTDETKYFSHRRDKGKTGRHLAVIALTSEVPTEGGEKLP